MVSLVGRVLIHIGTISVLLGGIARCAEEEGDRLYVFVCI